MTSEGYVSEELTIVWMLLIITVTATYFIQRYKFHYIPPSAAAMLLGVLAGVAAKFAGFSRSLRFSPAVFFYGLLPPIVFAAGFTLKKRDFFRNFFTITVFAVLGTIISTLVFGLATYLLVVMRVVKRAHLGTAPLIECFLYGALISATDPVATLSVFSALPVPPLLYNLVFGESVLNDAVAIVLFRTLEEFYSAPLTWASLPVIVGRFLVIGLGSSLMGVVVALPVAFLLKRFRMEAGSEGGTADGPEFHNDVAFNGTIYEISLVVMSAYLAYLAAEVLKLSGIVALFFAGICHSHYSYYNITGDAQITLRRFFEFAAFLSETFVFAYLGMQVPTIGSKVIDAGLLITGVPLCLLSRAANVFPLAKLVNYRRKLPLPYNLQAMQWAVGLRGAVAYGLAVNLPQIDAESDDGIPAIESATLVIAFISTLVFGGMTGPLLRLFGLQGVDDAALHSRGVADMHASLTPRAAARQVADIQMSQSDELHQRWKAFDRNVMKPLFGGRDGGYLSPTATYGADGGGRGAAPRPAPNSHSAHSPHSHPAGSHGMYSTPVRPGQAAGGGGGGGELEVHIRLASDELDDLQPMDPAQYVPPDTFATPLLRR